MMKKQILFLAILTIISINCYSQIVFENGYFINKTNEKINCLIKNIDWKNNPINFDYKLPQSEEIKTGDIQNVKEFGVDSVFKYISTFVNIDRSNDDLPNISNVKNPIFREELLFLKVLIEGKASLYYYEDGTLVRFFYKVDDSEIRQLVYKSYLTNENLLAKNNYFRQQLFNDLKCNEVTLSEIEHINYTKRDLEKLFVKYNECTNSSYATFNSKQKRDLFNLTIRPGLNINNLSVQDHAYGHSINFDTDFNFRLGVEAEFIFPFNKNKWSAIIEPTYHHYISEKATEANYIVGRSLVLKVNYKSIELPIGIRYYFFLKNKSKIFVNLSYHFDIGSNSAINATRSDGSELYKLEINSRNSIVIGAGYKLKDRFGIEMRYMAIREILSDYLSFNSSYETFSIIFGYSLF